MLSVYRISKTGSPGKLMEIFNTTHENVVAVPDLVEAANDVDILIFVVRHQFIHSLGNQLLDKIETSALSLSVIKGIDVPECGAIELISPDQAPEESYPGSDRC